MKCIELITLNGNGNEQLWALIMAAGSYSYGCQGLMTPISTGASREPNVAKTRETETIEVNSVTVA